MLKLPLLVLLSTPSLPRGFTKKAIWKTQAATTERASTNGMRRVNSELTCFERPIASNVIGTGVKVRLAIIVLALIIVLPLRGSESVYSRPEPSVFRRVEQIMIVKKHPSTVAMIIDVAL